MLIKRIQALPQDTIIPKPKAVANFKIKGWGVRRGEPSMIYWIPNHKDLSNPSEKGITISEFERAYIEIMTSRKFTRAWFNANLIACAKEGSCNFTTIGGVFVLLGFMRYASRGIYVNC